MSQTVTEGKTQNAQPRDPADPAYGLIPRIHTLLSTGQPGQRKGGAATSPFQAKIDINNLGINQERYVQCVQCVPCSPCAD